MIAELSTKFADREEIRTREIARELVQEGYEVIQAPTKEQLPEFLRALSYLPDLLAFSEAENLVVEVKSRPSVRGDDQLAAIADAVNRQKSWRFLFVYSNPRVNRRRIKPASEQETYSLQAALDEAIAKASALNEPTDLKAYFLYSWSLLEAALQVASRRPLKQASISSYTVIRNARIDGLVSEEQFEELRELQQKRNRLAHGDFSTVLRAREVRMVLELGSSILRDFDR